MQEELKEYNVGWNERHFINVMAENKENAREIAEELRKQNATDVEIHNENIEEVKKYEQ